MRLSVWFFVIDLNIIGTSENFQLDKQYTIVFIRAIIFHMAQVRGNVIKVEITALSCKTNT